MRNQDFRVGGYLRLSNDDGANKQSESIDNQLLVLNQYLEKHKDLVLVDTYIDDGYTGMNYDRESFQRLMRDIETGKINTIITKDLSRLGRDQVETSRLIKKDFVIRKIRYIAIDDNIDTFSQEQNDIVVPFRILFNDFYSQDISVKIKAALNSKRKNGDFIGAFSPYGYKKDDKNNNMLIPDEEAADVVRRIFNMFIQGYGKMKIARELNKEGILCPTEYKKGNNQNYHNANKLISTTYWTYSTINRILSNEVYIGHMIQHKQEKIAYNLKQHRKVPQEQHIVVKDTHEPIIENETFETVQNLLKVKTRSTKLNENVTIYAGILKCGDCGRRLCKTVNKGKDKILVYYKCGTYKQYGKEYCTSHTIREDVLNDIILNAIKTEAKLALKQKDIEGLEQLSYKNSRGKEDSKIKDIQKQLDALEQEKTNMLRMLAKGIISENEYISFQESIEGEKKRYLELLDQIKDIQIKKEQDMEKHNRWVKRFINYIDIDEITREVLVALVEEIKVHEDKTVEITFKFKSPFVE